MVAEYIKNTVAPPRTSTPTSPKRTPSVRSSRPRQSHGGFDNTKIITYLHSGVTIQSVLGAVKFNSLGENNQPTAYTFQWQGAKFVEVNPTTDPGATKILFPKPAWKN